MERTEYRLNSIYRATEGEGIHIGTPQIFVRFQGCAIGCVNCDSLDTWEFSSVPACSLSEVLERIHQQQGEGRIQRVSITGGDPLHPKHEVALKELVQALKKENFFINLEAAGTRVLPEIFDAIDFISFDFKTPSTGVRTPIKHIEYLNEKFPHKFQIKAVIETKEDFHACLAAFEFVRQTQKILSFPWVLTPCYNLQTEFNAQIFQNILTWNEQSGGPFRVIGQQHKWVFGPDRKQV